MQFFFGHVECEGSSSHLLEMSMRLEVIEVRSVAFGFQRHEALRNLFRNHSVEKRIDVKSMQDRVRMKLTKGGPWRKESQRG